MTKINDLSEFASSYYEKADVYKEFSLAEDVEGHIWKSIKNDFKNKKVLDLGCGNGRYLKLINKETTNNIGLDQSLQQLNLADEKLNMIVGDGAKLPFSDNTFDIVVSFWVWGTILDLEKRQSVFKECLRVLKNNGEILLIENDTPSEFEYYRGRHLNDKTKVYNDWILNLGFKEYKKVKTNITFENVRKAQEVFKEIWKGKLFALPQKNTIENNVIIFKYTK